MLAGQRAEGTVTRSADREQAVEARDAEDPHRPGVVADDRERSARGAQTPRSTRDHPERGRIDERCLGEVDHYSPGPGFERALHRLLELRRAVQVDGSAD